jgi:creatinine amidohydrolase
VLDGIARSLKAGGFKTICFIADHGGSTKPQAEVAARLSREWAAEGITVISVDDYYNAAGDAQNRYLEGQGETPATIGQHAGITDTSELMAAHPDGVDLTRLNGLPLRTEPTGIDGNPARASRERGEALLAIKIDAAVRQIRQATPSQ